LFFLPQGADRIRRSSIPSTNPALDEPTTGVLVGTHVSTRCPGAHPGRTASGPREDRVAGNPESPPVCWGDFPARCEGPSPRATGSRQSAFRLASTRRGAEPCLHRAHTERQPRRVKADNDSGAVVAPAPRRGCRLLTATETGASLARKPSASPAEDLVPPVGVHCVARPSAPPRIGAPSLFKSGFLTAFFGVGGALCSRRGSPGRGASRLQPKATLPKRNSSAR